MRRTDSTDRLVGDSLTLGQDAVEEHESVSIMTREAASIDLSTQPDLARLVAEVKRTRRPQALQEDGETVALLVPAGRPRRATKPRHQLVDTSALPPVHYRSVAELVRHQPVAPARSFTDDELKEAIDEARAEAWRAKHS